MWIFVPVFLVALDADKPWYWFTGLTAGLIVATSPRRHVAMELCAESGWHHRPAPTAGASDLDETPRETTRPVPADLDATIHAPKRLVALANLRGATEAEFSFLKDQLDLVDSDLSKQMATLIDAGMVSARKTGHGRGSSTWYRLTAVGRDDFDAYRNALRSMLDD